MRSLFFFLIKFYNLSAELINKLEIFARAHNITGNPIFAFDAALRNR